MVKIDNTPRLRSPKTAQELIDMYFLDARSHLLETAAFLDRVERAADGGPAQEDPRIQKLLAALTLLSKASGNRAEQFQLLFSDRN